MIPAELHMTWLSRSLDVERANNVNSMKNRNRDFGFKLWTNDEMGPFIEYAYGREMRKIFDAINPLYGAARADFFRYCLMYHQGGVYFDIKSCARIPLHQFVGPRDGYILVGGATANRFELQQWVIICEPRHQFLKHVLLEVCDRIESYDINKHGVGKNAVLRTTGPIPYTSAILPIMEKHPHRYIDGARELTYDVIGHRRREADPRHYSNQREPLIL